MPSRIICLGIVLVWLGFNSWLFYRDLLPRLLPGQPPPYTIDLVEETRTRRPYIEWNVEHAGQRAFRARTYVDHPDHDVFHLVADFTTPNGEAPPIHGIRVKRMSSIYRVSTAGDLLGVAVTIEGQPQLARALKLIAGDFTASIEGDVEGGRLTPRLTLELPGKKFERDLPTVTVPSGGAVLLPLHPVNRVQGISLGQSWTLRVFDPIAGSLGALGGGGELQFIRAKVRPRTETFTYGKRRDVECLVIDYEGDDMKASTWVAKERGLVLCQEATLDNARWVMYRE